MHPILKSFNRLAARPRYVGADGLVLDDEKIIFVEKDMPIQVELSQGQMNNIIRLLKTADVSRVQSISVIAVAALSRLHRRRRLQLAATTTPLGSDQYNIGSFVAWTKQLTRADNNAIDQLLVIDATSAARLT